MAIINRDKDVSEQKQSYHETIKLFNTTGGTFPILLVPYNAEVRAVQVAARALSGAPTVEVEAHRFVAGAGVTVNSSIMTALTMKAFGTSGIANSLSLGVAGSTQVQVAAGDLLVATCVGANTGADDVVVSVVLKCLQDIKSDFGSAS